MLATSLCWKILGTEVVFLLAMEAALLKFDVAILSQTLQFGDMSVHIISEFESA